MFLQIKIVTKARLKNMFKNTQSANLENGAKHPNDLQSFENIRSKNNDF